MRKKAGGNSVTRSWDPLLGGWKHLKTVISRDAYSSKAGVGTEERRGLSKMRSQMIWSVRLHLLAASLHLSSPTLIGSFSFLSRKGGLMSPEKERLKQWRDNYMWCDVPAARHDHCDQGDLPGTPCSVAVVIMPGTASGREQGLQEPHQFLPTGAAGTHFQCN